MDANTIYVLIVIGEHELLADPLNNVLAVLLRANFTELIGVITFGKTKDPTEASTLRLLRINQTTSRGFNDNIPHIATTLQEEYSIVCMVWETRIGV